MKRTSSATVNGELIKNNAIQQIIYNYFRRCYKYENE